MNLLIVEDDEMHVALLLRIIKEEFSNIYVAKDGLEALDYLDVINIDCMIIDMMLPRMGGEELINNLNKKERKPRFLVCSAKEEDYEVRRIKEKGASAYICKPYIVSSFIAELKKLKEGKRDE